MHQKEKIHRSKITKKAKGLYSENYTPLKKEIEENTNKCKDIPSSETATMSMLPKAIL